MSENTQKPISLPDYISKEYGALTTTVKELSGISQCYVLAADKNGEIQYPDAGVWKKLDRDRCSLCNYLGEMCRHAASTSPFLTKIYNSGERVTIWPCIAGFDKFLFRLPGERDRLDFFLVVMTYVMPRADIDYFIEVAKRYLSLKAAAINYEGRLKDNPPKPEDQSVANEGQRPEEPKDSEIRKTATELMQRYESDFYGLERKGKRKRKDYGDVPYKSLSGYKKDITANLISQIEFLILYQEAMQPSRAPKDKKDTASIFSIFKTLNGMCHDIARILTVDGIALWLKDKKKQRFYIIGQDGFQKLPRGVLLDDPKWKLDQNGALMSGVTQNRPVRVT